MPRVAQVTAEVPLLTFGRIGGGIAQAEGGSKAAELMAQQARLNLRVEVAQAYAQSAVSRRLVASYDLLRLSLGQTLRQSELMFQAGAATSTDIAQARARLAEAEAGYARANGNLATSAAHLRSLTGVEVRDRR